ncbi:MAG: hypothetical protein IK082_06575 [Oscillospiraceae bacterium]|nr:hypothetical protein [Oscillospiraceae bacterium]
MHQPDETKKAEAFSSEALDAVSGGQIGAMPPDPIAKTDKFRPIIAEAIKDMPKS